METKRFIGNDMPRIYDRVRREFGPDAVIVRTRSLYREGAEPLIEVVAAPPSGDGALPLGLQQALLNGALERTERSLTVGDLEDLVARDSGQQAAFEQRFAPAEPFPAPEWLEGFVESPQAAPSFALSSVAEAAAAQPWPHVPVFRLPETEQEPGAPSSDWARRERPRIVTRDRAAAAPETAEELFGDGGFSLPSLEAELLAAGLSIEAARIIATAAPGEEPAAALATVLDSREVRYPDEQQTALITIQGPVGSGRTTALMRMALDCADAGRRALLIAADGTRVAGRQQVRAYGQAIGLDVIEAFEPHEIIRAATRAPRGTCLFVDVPAGQWQAPAMPHIGHYAYLALPAHWSRGALAAAVRGVPSAAFAGAVLTFTDVATELPPVISHLVESPLGLAFLSSGRDVATGIDVADSHRLASGIFTMRTGESTNGRLAASA